MTQRLIIVPYRMEEFEYVLYFTSSRGRDVGLDIVKRGLVLGQMKNL